MKSVSWKEARNILRNYREQNERQSPKVVNLWDKVIKESSDKFGDEKFIIWEQVCVAAVDCNRIDVADECLQRLSEKFPNSCRVRLLEVLILESLERFDNALEILTAMISDDETNPAPYKRKVAILKAKGNINEAIVELNDYLKKFAMDHEAWTELSELYLSEQEFSKAAFCMEELILHNPHVHLYHLRFADIKYTQGGLENLELASAYYSQALKLSPSNMRALFGLYLCAKHISSSPKCNIAKKNKEKETLNWCLEQIQARYDEVADVNQVNGVSKAFDKLSISTSKYVG